MLRGVKFPGGFVVLGGPFVYSGVGLVIQLQLDIRVESTVTGRYMHAVLSTRPHAEDLVQAPFRHLVASLYGLG